MLPLFEQLPSEQQQCVLAIAGGMYGNIVQQLQALLPQLDALPASHNIKQPGNLLQLQQQEELHQEPSLLQPELSMMPPPSQQLQSGSFVLPELSVLMASSQQQQQQDQHQQQQQHEATDALHVELSVMPPQAQEQQHMGSWFPSQPTQPIDGTQEQQQMFGVVQQQQLLPQQMSGIVQQQQQQQLQQQMSGVVQTQLSALPPHQVLLQQQRSALAAADAFSHLDTSPTAGATAVPMLSVVASTSAAAAAAAAAAAGAMTPAPSVNPFAVAAADDFEQSFMHSLSVAVPPAAAGAAAPSAPAAAEAAAAAVQPAAAPVSAPAAVAGPCSAPAKRDRAAFKQQQQHDETELIQLMSSSLSLSQDAPSAKQLRQSTSSSGKTDNSPGIGANEFSFSLQLPSGLSLPGMMSGLSSPRFTVNSSSSFPFINSSVETPTGSAAAAAAAAAATGGVSIAPAVPAAAAAVASQVAAGSSAVDTACAVDVEALPAVQQARALYNNLQALMRLLASGGATVLFQLFDCSSVSSSSSSGGACDDLENLGHGGSQSTQHTVQRSAWDMMKVQLPGDSTAAAAAAVGGAEYGTRNSSSSPPVASDATAYASSQPQHQQQQQMLRCISLSQEQRQALQQLLSDAVAAHLANSVCRKQHLASLAVHLASDRPSGIASARLCSAGVASWEAVQSLVEAVQAGCAADVAVLQRVMSQAWGPQVGASCSAACVLKLCMQPLA
jgi:hypothetical protein